MKKGFTIIEILVILMVISFLSVAVLGGYNYFTEEQIKQNNLKKLRIIENDFEKILNFRINSFFYKENVIFEEENIYETGKRVSIYDKEDREKYSSFWKVNGDTLMDFGNIPLDIIIENKYFDFYTIMPYKNIFVISWGRLNSYPSFNQFKDLFFSKDSYGNFTYLNYSTLKKKEESGENIEKFDELKQWLEKNKIDQSFLNKEINYVKLNNMNIIKNKMQVTINKINKIEDNIKFWVSAQTRSVMGTGSMPGKDFFIFKKYATYSESIDGLKTIFIDTMNDATNNYKDNQLANVFSFINGSVADGQEDRYITTEDFGLTCRSESFDFEITGFAPIDENYINCESHNSNYQILPSTKRIMGVISNIDGQDELSGFPILVSNIKGEFKFEDIKGDSQTLKVLSSHPKIDGSKYNTPPYNISLGIIFPWIVDGNFDTASINASLSQEEQQELKATSVYYNSFGLYIRKIYSVSYGI